MIEIKLVGKSFIVKENGEGPVLISGVKKRREMYFTVLLKNWTETMNFGFRARKSVREQFKHREMETWEGKVQKKIMGIWFRIKSWFYIK